MTMILVRLRCLTVAAVATSALGAAARALAGGLVVPAADDGAAALTALCTGALLAALTWGWAAVLAGAGDAWRQASPGARGPAAQRPGGVRRWTLAACGVAVTGAALAGPAAQASPAPLPVAASTAQATVLLDAPVAARAHPGTLVVRPGDCLWSLASAEVQPGAGPATVTARWRAIYRANRAVIGEDPDVIRPGQRLRLPR